MTTNHIDQLTQWWEGAEQGPVSRGDLVIKRHPDGRYTIREAEKGWENTNYRILSRAPKPKPAWHDAVAVMAVTPASPSRGVLVAAGEGEWHSYRWNRHVKSDDLRDVTPLIEAKVTDEMVKRGLGKAEEHGYIERVFGDVEQEDRDAIRSILTAALGLDPA